MSFASAVPPSTSHGFVALWVVRRSALIRGNMIDSYFGNLQACSLGEKLSLIFFLSYTSTHTPALKEISIKNIFSFSIVLMDIFILLLIDN